MAIQKLQLAVEVSEDPKGFSGSIQQVEQLEDRVKALTKDTVELRKQKEAVTAQLRAYDRQMASGTRLTQEQGKQVEALTLRESELANSLGRSEFSSRTARQELRNLNFAANDARMEAQLLAAQFGVHLPVGIDKLLSRLPAVQQGISKAFNAGIMVAFGVAGGQALARLIVEITQFDSTLQGLKQTIADVFSPFEAAARGLHEANVAEASEKQSQRVLASIERARKTREETALTGREGTDLLRAQQAQAIEELRRRQQQEGLPLGVVAQEAVAINQKFGAEISAALAKRTEELRKRVDALEEQEARLAEQEARLAEQERKTLLGPGIKTVEVEAGLGAHPEAVVAAGERIKTIGATQAKIRELEADAEVARLTGNQRTLAQIALQEQRHLAEYRKLLDEGIIFQSEYEQARTAIAIDAEGERMEVARRAAEEQRQLIEATARDWESMFDRITGGAHNMGDVLGNIFDEIKRAWKRQIFEMLAAAVVGGKAGPSSATGASLGMTGGRGILGSILGSVLGGGIAGGGQAVGAATPPFIPNQFAAGTSALSGLGLAGAGGLGGGIFAAAAQPTQAAAMGLPATTPIGDLLSKVFPHSIGGVGGPTLALGGLTLAGLGLGHGSLLGALGGLAGGALTGFAVGGPIGAIVGGIIGGIAGLFGGNKKKESDARIEEQGFATIKQLLEEYSRQRIDYASTFEGYQQVHQQMQGAFQRPQSKRHEQYWFDQYIKQLQGIEDERNRRRDFLSGFAVPEFESGGFVDATAYSRARLGNARLGNARLGFAAGGEVPAILHSGEYVMSRPAVERWGADLLARMNSSEPRGQASGGDGYEMHIWAPSKAWAAKVVEEGLAVVIGKGGRASKMLRG